MIDCFDGAVISWTISTKPNAEMVNSMLDNAVATLSHEDSPIIHSDRGAHYRWPEWIQRMKKAKLVRSMSKKGYSPDIVALLDEKLQQNLIFVYSYFSNISSITYKHLSCIILL